MPRITNRLIIRAVLEGIRDGVGSHEVFLRIERDPELRPYAVTERQIQRLFKKFRDGFGNRWKFTQDAQCPGPILKTFIPAMFDMSDGQRAWVTELEAKWFVAIYGVMPDATPNALAVMAIEYAFAELEGRDTREFDLALSFGVLDQSVPSELRRENYVNYRRALKRDDIDEPEFLTWQKLEMLGVDFNVDGEKSYHDVKQV